MGEQVALEISRGEIEKIDKIVNGIALGGFINLDKVNIDRVVAKEMPEIFEIVGCEDYHGQIPTTCDNKTCKYREWSPQYGQKNQPQFTCGVEKYVRARIFLLK